MADETKKREQGEANRPYWERYGHASEDDFWEQVRADLEYTGLNVRRRSRKSLPDPSLPRGEPPRRRDRARTRQVNVKVTPADYAELERAARLYGVATSTMAQLLVKRGVQAVLEAEGVQAERGG